MAQKKRPDAGFAQLKKDLAAGELGNLYLFHGEEDYLRDYYLGAIRKKLLPEGAEVFNLHTFQGKDLNLQELSDCVDALPMMNERTVVIVYDFDLFRNEERRNRLEELFQDLPDYLCLIFVYDILPYKSGGNTRLGKLVKKVGCVVDFQPQRQSDLNGWIRRHFRALGKEIDNTTAEYLTFLCGGLMTGLGSEIQKIGTYASGPTVTRADVDAVATPVLDAKVFTMSDAIAAGQFDQAMGVLSELYQMNEPPIRILAALGTQLRQMWSARLALEQKRGQGYLVDLWKLRTGWQARKLLDSARQFDLSWCRDAVAMAAETDLAMKSAGRDPEELLVELVLKLAASRQGVRGC